MTLKTSAKPIALAAAASGLLSLPAAADQLSDIMSRKELNCGTFADVPPFAAPDKATREMVGHRCRPPT